MGHSVLQRSPSRKLTRPAPIAADRGPAQAFPPMPAALATSQGTISQPSSLTFQGLSQELLSPSGHAISPVTQPPGGRTLPPSVRSHLEAILGEDFSDVQVRESQIAAQLGAQAFTTGNQITFAPGQLDMTSRKGRELLGHELAHVVQQRQGRVQPQTQFKPFPINGDPTLEHEADRIGAHVAQGKPSTGLPTFQRTPPSQPPVAPVQMKLKNPFKALWRRLRGQRSSQANAPVNIIPNNTNHSNPQAHPQPRRDSLDEYVSAYNQARFYHGLNWPGALFPSDRGQGILAEGLDPKFGGQGAARIDREYSEQSEGKVHVARQADQARYYGPTLRVFLPPERTVYHANPWTKDAADHELVNDPHYRGQGATTRQLIGPENILAEGTDALLEGGNLDAEHASTILGTIGQHLHQQTGRQRRLGSLRELHRRAIDDRRISVEGLDVEKLRKQYVKS
ncbi:eCIS core domain-containing protein [Trichothermofontia sp.]